jgi:hypothetical protein
MYATTHEQAFSPVVAEYVGDGGEMQPERSQSAQDLSGQDLTGLGTDLLDGRSGGEAFLLQIVEELAFEGERLPLCLGKGADSLTQKDRRWEVGIELVAPDLESSSDDAARQEIQLWDLAA